MPPMYHIRYVTVKVPKRPINEQHGDPRAALCQEAIIGEGA